MRARISVIVPVYQVEKYLSKCLDSILAQTFIDFEVLLINDGSYDLSGVICDKYASKDSRIRVIHKKNGGVSSARNTGIDCAEGEWICFVDSDDYVDPNYLSNLLRGVDNNTDIVYANYDSYNYIPREITLDTKSAIDFMIENSIFSMSGPVAKLYKTKLIHDYNIRFPINVHMGEDAIFNLEVMNVAIYMSFHTCNDYHINYHSGSLSTKYYSFKSEYKAYKLWKIIELNLFLKYYNYDDALNMTWNIRIEGQFNRVLQCIYRHNPKYTISEQIKLLHLIDSQDIQEYNKYYNPIKWRRRLNKSLIVNKMFVSYVLLGLCDRLIYKGA